MRLIRVGAAALNQTPLAWDQNRRNIEQAITAARDAEVGLLCLPELCITGYGCEDAFLSPAVQRTAWAVLHEIAPATRGIAVALGLPVYVHSGLYNTVCLVADGRVLGFVAKRHLPADGLHYEPRWFRPWPAAARTVVERDGGRYPFGDLLFACGDVGIGIEICEDAWVAARPGIDLMRRGADVILNPSASHFAFGKHAIRRRLAQESSRQLGAVFVFTNLLGNEAGRTLYDGDARIASAGELVAATPRLSFADVQLTAAVVDIDRNRGRRGTASGLASRPADDGRIACELGLAATGPTTPVLAEVAEPLAQPNEEFARAASLGLFDYLRKCKSNGFVVSLSGGADSAACACLVALMVENAQSELGRAGLIAKLAHVTALAAAKDSREAVHCLLTTVYQSTANSSTATRQAARTLAENIGARHLELDVEDVTQRYVAMVARALGRPLDWTHDDLALQNVQARARAPSAWLIANLGNALLLTTGNRSEAAVGYATMDGDTSGGLAPLAGVDKTFLRGWLRWLERDGPTGQHPFGGLAPVNALVPTAELRPPDQRQSDEADLMPYAVLDAIARLAVRDRASPSEVVAELKTAVAPHSEAQLRVWVERFYTLWARNQWKRERLAPSFHLDDANVDPRTWCRFPILSGGFAREIDGLRRTAVSESKR